MRISGIGQPAQQSIHIDHERATDSGGIAIGGSVILTVNPPSGYLLKILALKLSAPAPTFATTGSHTFYIYHDNHNTPVLSGSSNFNTDLLFDDSIWRTANNWQRPTTEIAILTTLYNQIFSPSDDLKIEYQNNTDVVQPGTVEWELMLRYLKNAL